VYIVKEKDEDKINQVAELAGERSKKLQDTVKTIQAIKGAKELSVEIIEQAIDIVNGKKKWTDLVGYQSTSFSTTLRSREIGISFTCWPVFKLSKKPLNKRISIPAMLWKEPPLCVKKRKSYIDSLWNYHSESDIVCTSLAREKPLERGVLLVRNR
jgi:hypothetical protein